MNDIEKLSDLETEMGMKIIGVSLNHENPNLTKESVSKALVDGLERLKAGYFEEVVELNDY